MEANSCRKGGGPGEYAPNVGRRLAEGKREGGQMGGKCRVVAR